MRVLVAILLIIGCCLIASGQVIQTPFGPIENPWHHLTARLYVVYDADGTTGVPVRLDKALMEICSTQPYVCDRIFTRNGFSFDRSNP